MGKRLFSDDFLKWLRDDFSAKAINLYAVSYTHLVENFYPRDIRWISGRAHLVTKRLYTFLDFISIKGLTREDQVLLETANYAQCDICLLYTSNPHQYNPVLHSVHTSKPKRSAGGKASLLDWCKYHKLMAPGVALPGRMTAINLIHWLNCESMFQRQPERHTPD